MAPEDDFCLDHKRHNFVVVASKVSWGEGVDSTDKLVVVMVCSRCRLMIRNTYVYVNRGV